MQIVVTIKTDGTSTVRVSDTIGSSCTKATKDLQGALGATISDVKTADYYATPTTNAQRRMVTQ